MLATRKNEQKACETILKDQSISIVIPTFNREEDLMDALLSILRQKKLPKEVVVVDDSENDRTRNLIKKMRKSFLDKGVSVKYLRNPRGKSTSSARNVGATCATGEIILFLDDDVILDDDYISEILEVYERHPDAVGVQGYVENLPMQILSTSGAIHNSICKIFFLFFFEKHRCRVLPSWGYTYPCLLNGVINCEWLGGENQSFRKKIFQTYKFDENLKKYSYGEDADLSYRIFKNNPISLYMTPNARLFHKKSKTSRLPDELRIYITTINRTYLFYKNIEQTLFSKLIFLWSSFGQVILHASVCVLQIRNKGDSALRMKYLLGIKHLIKSYIYMLKHLKEIKAGHIEFFDDMLCAT